MTGFDRFMNNSDAKVDLNELMRELAPEFVDLTGDIKDIAEKHYEPFFIAMLLFKLAEERKKTNELMENINRKLDELAFAIKQGGRSANAGEDMLVPSQRQEFTILPEQDQKILELVESKGMVDAKTVQQAFNYKGLNAASQRLNKLFREGHLKKVRAGRKVIYLAKT
jgi:hypothetical protein